MQPDDTEQLAHDLSRREFIETAAAVSGLAMTIPVLDAQTAVPESGHVNCSLSINKIRHTLSLDPRVTLLDLLREQLHLTGTKKGCDHGQCGACTVLANGERINSCLALAVSYDGAQITSIEGLASGDRLHPIQQAFLESDGFQCGFCTPGQICSSIAMLEEARRGVPSAVSRDLSKPGPVDLTEDEARERMSGNLCRCGAYPNIVAAVRSTYHRGEL